MSALEMFIKGVEENKGIIRQRRLINLRIYIKESTDAELIRVIRRMTNKVHLKILWEAGLRQPLQKAVGTRYHELTTRRSTR